MFAAAHAQPLDGPFVTGLRRISEERHITLMGTVHAVPGAADAVPDKPASCATDSRASNVFVVIRDGALIAAYRKLMTAARALENTCYVLACSEVSARNIGCSRVIDPLGEVIAQASDGQGGLCGQGETGGQAGMLIARLHREVLESARRTLPVLENRRFADPQLRD